MLTPEIVLQWNVVPGASTYNVYRGATKASVSDTPYATGITAPAPISGSPFSMTSCATGTSGSTLYTGTFSNGGSNAFAGRSFTVTGFTNAINNGTFLCTASTITTITLGNPSGTAETATAFAAVVTDPIAHVTYTDLAVIPGRSYFYEVTCVSRGVESADSLGIESAPVPFDFTPISPDLNGLDNFSVLAASTITNTGSTTILGDVGLYPGTSITGFPPGALSGLIHTADFVSATGQGTAQTLYNALQAYAPTATLAGDIGGMTLAPGVYKSTSSLAITGELQLDAGGNPNAVWIFQIASTLTTAASNSTIVMTNGGNAGNVFWQVGSSATIGTATTFTGCVVAQASITVNTGASVSGRLIALVGAITLDSNSIILFDSAPFMLYAAGNEYVAGEIIFDTTSGLFEVVSTAGVAGPFVFALSSVADAVSGSAVYTGVISGGAGNALVGHTFSVTAFAGTTVTASPNNGTFLCSGSSATTLTLNNPAAISEVSSGTATDMAPARGPFPTVPGVYTTDGTVVWYSVSPVGVFLQLPLPPSPPNVPPTAPAAPTGLIITLET